MKNVPNLHYHFQSACCMIDSCFELLVELMIRWLTGAWLSGPVSMDPVSTVNRYLIQAWHIWLIWQLQFGLLQNQVAALFQVRPSTISKLKVKFHMCQRQSMSTESRFCLWRLDHGIKVLFDSSTNQAWSYLAFEFGQDQSCSGLYGHQCQILC